MSHERRNRFRVPVEICLNEYVRDEPHRAMSANLSEKGMYLSRVAPTSLVPGTVVGLEFELPGTGEVIWARGEVRHDARDEWVYGQGIAITGIPSLYARLLREFCWEERFRIC